MNTSAPSRLSRIVVRTGTILFFIFCVPGLAQAQWEPTYTGSNDIHNTNSGNVGIGTPSPGSTLEIQPNGGAAVGKGIRLSNGAGGHSWELQAGAPGINNNYFTLTDITASNAVRLTVNEFGNVGIGMTSPSTTLDVNTLHGGIATFSTNGTAQARFGVVDAANSWLNGSVSGDTIIRSESGNLLLGTAPNNTLYLKSNGSVGIGTTNPFSPLDIKTATDKELLVRQASDFSGLSTAVALHAVNSTHDASIPLSIESLTLTLNAATGGNVGIGTTNPTHKLEVEGTFHANGAITGTTINATYQDVAEWVPSVQKLPAGTVVVLDTAKSNHVLASSSSYDMKVAGVISVQPGISLGIAGEDKVLVATTGRVKVKVDASSAPIHVGDLLVTSDSEGVAMRSEPIVIGGRKIHAPGTIVGKALEPLEKGTGEILVLLSLQ